MKDIKIAFFDVDGTLVNPRTGLISARTKETLIRLRQKGILLCIATGRPPASLPDLTGLPFDAFLTCNGALCYTEDRIIAETTIPADAVQKVIANAAALGRPVTVALRDRLAANGTDPDLAEYYRMAGLELTVAEDFDAAAGGHVYQMMLGCRISDHGDIIRGADGVAITYSWDRAADVIPIGGGKGIAVMQILEHFNLSADQAIAFGDGFNDRRMLQTVGTGVAMGNADPRVTAVSMYQTASNNEDGIGVFLREHLLEQKEGRK